MEALFSLKPQVKFARCPRQHTGRAFRKPLGDHGFGQEKTQDGRHGSFQNSGGPVLGSFFGVFWGPILVPLYENPVIWGPY